MGLSGFMFFCDASEDQLDFFIFAKGLFGSSGKAASDLRWGCFVCIRPLAK